MESDISAVVQVVFNAPVGTGHLEQGQGRNFFPCQASDAVYDLFVDFTSFGYGKAPFELEDLL